MSRFAPTLRLFSAVALAFLVIGGLLAQGTPAESGAAAGGAVKAAEPDKSVPDGASAEALLREVSTAEMDKAIKEGLEYLASLQDEKKGCFGETNTRVATTALAGTALLASGSLPDSGPYGSHISKVLDYLLSVQDPTTGYICGADDGSRIHGHGFAVTFLASVLGHSSKDKEVKRALGLAVMCLEKGQTKEGGWGYVPSDFNFDEASTTVCCMQALRTAQMAGIKVDNVTISRSISYFEKSADRQIFRDPEGTPIVGYTFKYSLASGSSSQSYALVAASCSCLNYLGVYSSYAKLDQKRLGEVLAGGMNWLRYQWDNFVERFKGGPGGLDTSHFYYTTYYATQANWQYSDVSYFRYFFPRIRDMLIDDRKNSGSKGWKHGGYGAAYATALSLLMLQVPYQYLPCYQR